MGEAKRKAYTASFKAKIGLEAIRGVKTANEIGQHTHSPFAHTAPRERRGWLKTPAVQQSQILYS